MFLGGSGRKFLIVDILASPIRGDYHPNQPCLAGPGDDGFQFSSSISNFDDPVSGYSRA